MEWWEGVYSGIRGGNNGRGGGATDAAVKSGTGKDALRIGVPGGAQGNRSISQRHGQASLKLAKTPGNLKQRSGILPPSDRNN
jgi:hypothetical protein